MQIPLVERDFLSFVPSSPHLCLWASVSCRRDEPLAMGYCGFRGSYKDYFGRQLTLAGNFDLYFLMIFAQYNHFYISTPVTIQKFPFAFLVGIFSTQQ